MELILSLLVFFNSGSLPDQPKLKTPVTVIEQTNDPELKKITGIASYYSRVGCLGCSETMTMANGEPLDDTKLTVAFNKAPLNHFIDVNNMANGKSVKVKVTDRGGFERHGRIIDLSVATKEAIGCTDLCKVEITY